MTLPIDEIAYEHLSAAERIVLAMDILDSVVADARTEALTPEQLATVRRRVADIDAGRVQTLAWSDVRDGFLRGGA